MDISETAFLSPSLLSMYASMEPLAIYLSILYLSVSLCTIYYLSIHPFITCPLPPIYSTIIYLSIIYYPSICQSMYHLSISLSTCHPWPCCRDSGVPGHRARGTWVCAVRGGAVGGCGAGQRSSPGGPAPAQGWPPGESAAALAPSVPCPPAPTLSVQLFMRTVYTLVPECQTTTCVWVKVSASVAGEFAGRLHSKGAGTAEGVGPGGRLRLPLLLTPVRKHRGLGGPGAGFLQGPCHWHCCIIVVGCLVSLPELLSRSSVSPSVPGVVADTDRAFGPYEH